MENEKQLETSKNRVMSTTKTKEFLSNPNSFLPEMEWIREYDSLKNADKELTPDQKKRKKELFEEISLFYGLENGLWTLNLDREKYYGTLGQMRRKVVEENNCRGPIEFMLADKIVGCYWRSHKLETILNHVIENKEGGYSYNQLTINYINQLNKGIELASRQLNANIILLKELKQPPLNVRVKADNAYFAQNQQINTKQENNTNDHQ